MAGVEVGEVAAVPVVPVVPVAAAVPVEERVVPPLTISPVGGGKGVSDNIP